MPTKTKKTGRPAELDRTDLLDAAERLFSEHGYDGTTTREVVKRAKCNLALISYHFGGKEGLYQAVLVRHFEKLKAEYSNADFSEAAIKHSWPEITVPVQREFCAALFEIVRTISSNTQMQKILCREMMSGGMQMVAALSKSESGVFNLLKRRLAALQSTGELDRALDLRFGILSLIGPAIYSCIAAPVVEGIYGLGPVNEAYMRKLCVHQTRTFFVGWASKESR
jgi:AcrR family transcriptional regulator